MLASPSPSVVPKPWSNPSYVDPEEAFIASLASCHMLTFLWLATKEGFVVDSYEDVAVAETAKNEHGSPWVSRLTLRPRIVWTGEKRPGPADLERLHHRAHEQCYIANSVKTEIVVAGES